MERKQNRYKHTHSFMKHHQNSICLNVFCLLFPHRSCYRQASHVKQFFKRIHRLTCDVALLLCSF